MKPETFTLEMNDGASIIARHYSKPGALRLFITHGNGFAVDGYRIFWEPLLADFDVVLYDMRNHGLNPSAGGDGHHYRQFSQDITTIYEGVTQRIGKAESIGIFHSMSSRSAMKNAVELGSPFDKLVLFDPPSVPPRGHALYEAMQSFEIKLINWATSRRDRFASPDELEAEYSAARASSKWLPQARADMAKAVLQPDPEGGFRLSCQRELEAVIYLQALSLDLWPSAEQLKVPALLVGADPDGDGAPPTGPANRALAQEGGYTYHGMKGTGHLLQIEQPERCRDVLYDFIAGR
ncbi:alpha/beta hydrolase [Aquamicrobium segne]|uniref:Alpha/beta hydrolase n=1 Tax=Aquamicrobium segne TaxID=469547 RepID=A0ABW0GW88_9HYPH